MAGASRRSCASPLPAAPGDATEPAARPRRVPRASSERGTQQGACPQCPPVSPVVGTRQGPAAAPCECAGRAGRSGSGGAGAAAPRNSQRGKKERKKKIPQLHSRLAGTGNIGIPKATLILLECRGGISPSGVYIRAASARELSRRGKMELELLWERHIPEKSPPLLFCCNLQGRKGTVNPFNLRRSRCPFPALGMLNNRPAAFSSGS